MVRVAEGDFYEYSGKLGLEKEKFFHSFAVMNFDIKNVKELVAHRRSIKPVDMDASKEVTRELLGELTELSLIHI